MICHGCKDIDRDVQSEIVAFLRNEKAEFKIIEHPPEGNSIAVASVRGTSITQGAKVLVCEVLGKGVGSIHVLAVLSGADRANLKAIGRVFGGRSARIADSTSASSITACPSGAMPPFVLHNPIPIVADARFLAQHFEIAFNAGRLDRSIILRTVDYDRMFKPIRGDIALHVS